MTRLISFGVLLGLVVLFGLLSFRVMANFLLPMLLAAMLVVIFGPLHRGLRDRFGLAEWGAAAVTTLFVLVIVLAPLFMIVSRAVGDTLDMLRSPDGMRLDPTVLDGLVQGVNDATGLQLTSESVNAELVRLEKEWLKPIATRAPVVIAKLLIGLVVMTVSLFYFLADGRRMFEAVMRLVPLDRR